MLDEGYLVLEKSAAVVHWAHWEDEDQIRFVCTTWVNVGRFVVVVEGAFLVQRLYMGRCQSASTAMAAVDEEDLYEWMMKRSGLRTIYVCPFWRASKALRVVRLNEWCVVVIPMAR